MTASVHNLAPLEPGTRALVLGLGRTGLSSARYLDRKGLEVRVADTRSEPPGIAALRAQVPAAEVRTGAFESGLLDGVAQVVISPGLSVREPVAVEAMSRGVPVVGDIELFAREAQAPVAAITGTNGKSTVTALLAELANAAHRVGDRRRQPRRAGARPARAAGARAVRARAVELPARDHALARDRDGDGAQRHSRSHGSL